VDRDPVLRHCLDKPGAWQDEPWEGDVVVKVATKIFAFFGSAESGESAVGLECGRSRDEADEWLRRFPVKKVTTPADQRDRARRPTGAPVRPG